NWKLGRVDRRGARRVALAQFGISFIVWIGRVHAVPSDTMVNFCFNAIAQLMLPAFLLWLLYIALEPALRSRWPHSIVTWNRLLAGRWLDPQVCAHILIGAAVGMALWTAISAYELRSIARNGLDSGGYLFTLEGSRQWVAAHMSQVNNSLQSGFILFFLLFGLRTILRRDWIAALVGSFLFAFIFSDIATTSKDWVMYVTIRVIIYAVILVILLRFGLVVNMAVLFFINTIGGVVFGTDWKTWYTPTAFATVALLLGISLFSFWRSLGDRNLIGGDASTVVH